MDSKNRVALLKIVGLTMVVSFGLFLIMYAVVGNIKNRTDTAREAGYNQAISDLLNKIADDTQYKKGYDQAIHDTYFNADGSMKEEEDEVPAN